MILVWLRIGLLIATQAVSASLPDQANVCLDAFLALNYATVYEKGQCHDNCRGIAERLRDAQFPIEKTKVLLLVPTKEALFPRIGPIGWSGWHAVVEHDGFILDLDYPEAKAIPKQVYFQRMFNANPAGGSWTNLSDVEVKAVPAQEFIEGENQFTPWKDPHRGDTIQRRKNLMWWLHDDEVHPWLPAGDYFGSSPSAK